MLEVVEGKPCISCRSRYANRKRKLCLKLQNKWKIKCFALPNLVVAYLYDSTDLYVQMPQSQIILAIYI